MEIWSRKVGSWSFASSLLTSIILAYIIIIHYCCGYKNYCGEERPKYLKAFLGSLFRQPITSHSFWFV
jgi:hypothetical protein